MQESKAPAETRQLNVAVIGGGLAGLAAAVSLMDKANVTIYEKSIELGGRAATAHKKGFDLNQGPHALYVGGYAYRFLSNLNLSASGGSPNISGGKAYYRGQLTSLPATLPSLLTTNMLTLGEKWQLATIFGRLPKIDTQSLMKETVNRWLDAEVRSPAVKAVLAAFIRLSSYCNNLDDMSAGAALAQLNLTLRGVVYLDHGWGTMVKALANKASSKVKFILGTKISDLRELKDTGRIQVRATNEDRSTELFDAVILAIPPYSVAQILSQHRDLFVNDLEQINAIVATRAACLDVCLNKLPVQSNTFALGIDQPLYFSVHSIGGKLSPPEGALVHVAYYLEPGKSGGIEHRTMLEDYLEKIQPSWRNHVVYERFMPNMVASFGCATATNKGHQGFANPFLNGAKNIYVCGDWVGNGHMLVDAAICSATEAAKLILAGD
jgi:phytoene dehydrogenase-like protein